MDNIVWQVSELEKRIQRLSVGEPVIIGGNHDIKYLREQIAQLASHHPEEVVRGLVEKLNQVNPELSSWETRKNLKSEPVIASCQIPKKDYVERFGLEEAVVETIGLEALRASKVLYSNYYRSEPFIAELAESLTQAQVERLTELGYKPMKLARNEALGLFVDIGQVRRAEKLQQDPKYLDKKIAEFMGREAGNHGHMYFISPPSDYKREIEIILSPLSVNIYSSFMGISVNRRVTNLIGAISEENTIYRKGAIVFIAPDPKVNK